MDEKSKNMHEGHRNRLREKFCMGGLDRFEEHEVLEMILFDFIPRKNTNELAHELIDYYGSLWQVFEAHPDELVKNFKGKGISHPVAVSLSQYMPVQKYIEINRTKNSAPLKNLGQAKAYFHALLSRARKEEFYLVCLDARFNVLYRIKIREGSVNRVSVDIREIADVVCRHGAVSIAIAHSHPSGDPVPSMGDDDFTRNLYVAMNLINVNFLDHMIVGCDKIYSYWEQNRIAEFNKDLFSVTKTPYSNLSVQLAQNKFLNDFYSTNVEGEHEYKTI